MKPLPPQDSLATSSLAQSRADTGITSLRTRFERLYAGVVYDAMCFDLHYAQPFVVCRAIRPMWPTRDVLFGPAFTCKGRRVTHPEHIDDAVRIDMFREFFAGCVQVIDADGDDRVAHFGDISGKLARKFGASGAVIDGYSRDLRLIEQDAFPLFCRGTQPADAYGQWQIIDYQTEIRLSGLDGYVTVRPGDYTFADADGVLIIPQFLGEEVCTKAEARAAREEEVRARLHDEADVRRLYDEMGRW
ncbi:RraA family protein [Paraburkholderia youngii]|uniref:Putative 4-hydroxy-4-methyl-2-oxoglutarate aldolase n=1 Tax=Paraburkholderia youngii TaxID=2782701 RepID=A0A7W8P797_9BURK|nr:RraA family protein [Paraburkholderia youngii]MBB5402647.1 regulator of RNase E activity RraA [Paraburkholderia youngii]